MGIKASSKMLAVVGAVLALGISAPVEAARSSGKGGEPASSARSSSKQQARPAAAVSSRGATGQVKGARVANARIGGHKGGKGRGTAFALRGGDAVGSYSTYSGGYLQCVPYARENSGIEISGNAGTWWGSAAGVYERGSRPETGSVLNFRSNGRMRMGHVAVVSRVVTPRVIEIDHANWGGPGGGRGRVTRSHRVVDVSEANDWSAVRVGLGNGDFGSIYPTYGFIYDRPDRGTMVANNRTEAMPVLASAAPRDLRPASLRVTATVDDADETEVAEAPEEDAAPQARRASARRSWFFRSASAATVQRPGRGAVQQTGRTVQARAAVVRVAATAPSRPAVRTAAPRRSR